jgi:hypothetical protein
LFPQAIKWLDILLTSSDNLVLIDADGIDRCTVVGQHSQRADRPIDMNSRCRSKPALVRDLRVVPISTAAYIGMAANDMKPRFVIVAIWELLKRIPLLDLQTFAPRDDTAEINALIEGSAAEHSSSQTLPPKGEGRCCPSPIQGLQPWSARGSKSRGARLVLNWRASVLEAGAQGAASPPTWRLRAYENA